MYLARSVDDDENRFGLPSRSVKSKQPTVPRFPPGLASKPKQPPAPRFAPTPVQIPRTAKAERKASLKKADGPFDCFLAHEWGAHETVRKVYKMLKEKGLKPWFDENQIRECIENDILKGLQESRKVVVFLTQKYLQRSKDFDTNAAKEFNSITKEGQVKIIVVVLEPEILDPITWKGTPVEFHLGHKKYIDFSTTENIRLNLKQLIVAISE